MPEGRPGDAASESRSPGPRKECNTQGNRRLTAGARTAGSGGGVEGRYRVHGWLGEPQSSRQLCLLHSPPPELRPHHGRPQPPGLPENLAASLKPRRSHPTSLQSPPATPQIRTGSFGSYPVTRASHCRQARGRLLDPTANRLPQFPAPVTSAARPRGVFLDYPGLPAWRSRGVAANHPIP